VDQALITGESVAVEKGPGATVYAGTINQHGVLEVRTTRAAEDAILARMVRMVEESHSRRAPSEQLVERFARWYTPAILMLALLITALPPLAGAGARGEWFFNGMVVLLIACPCALVISTPVSVVAALTSAARQGVLVKGGAFLEEAARLRALAFDKTAVLTRGEPEVVRLVALNGRQPDEVLRRLAGLEVSSEHPLGRAILRYAEGQGVRAPALEGFRARQGLGAEVESEGRTFWAGSARMLRERGLDNDEVRRQLGELSDAGHTVVACGLDGEVWALLAIADAPRKEGREALAELRRAGVSHLVMLSGDSALTSRSVGVEMGLDEVRAELLPEEKVEAVRALKAGYAHAGMVGDGVNDALALAEASLGIAVGWHGAGVAMESADVVLMQGDLRQLPFLVRHARRTVAVIRQNIALALGMKVLFLAAALTGTATLWLAVAADMGATFLVTFNGLRLLRARR
jgi:Cd2+/Zn2+-exporting ATPase